MKKLIERLLELQKLELAGTSQAGNENRITELRKQIPAQILGHYDRLMARGKKGVSVINGQVCRECHMQVPRNTVLTLMHGTDIQICESCGRYLCLPEHVNPAVPPPKSRKASAKPAAAIAA